MIKYAELKGYKNLGEVRMFSHIYQFIEKDVLEPKVIIIHAYDTGTPTVFKGFIYQETKQVWSVPIQQEELDVLEKYTGKLEQKSWHEFIKGTILDDTSCHELVDKGDEI